MAAWDVIATLDSPTAGVFTFTSLSLSGYETLQVRMSDITVTTDGTDVRMTFYVGGVEQTSANLWVYYALQSNVAVNPDSAVSQASMLLCSNDSGYDTGNAALESFAGKVTIWRPTSTALNKLATVECFHINPSSVVIGSFGHTALINAGAIDGIKIGGTSNLTAGKVRILGLS